MLRALAVNPKLPVKSVAELVAYAKKNPGKLNYGSAGPGSTVHILTESFRRAAGIDIVHIPYRGAAPAMQGLLAGDIEMMIDTVVIPHIKAGAVRGLAAVGPVRLDEMPDLPTLAEAGYPSVRTSGWSALFGPAKLPPELVTLYADHVEALFKDKAFLTRLIATGSVPAFLGPAPFADYVKEDNAYFGKLIRDAGIKLKLRRTRTMTRSIHALLLAAAAADAGGIDRAGRQDHPPDRAVRGGRSRRCVGARGRPRHEHSARPVGVIDNRGGAAASSASIPLPRPHRTAPPSGLAASGR